MIDKDHSDFYLITKPQTVEYRNLCRSEETEGEACNGATSDI